MFLSPRGGYALEASPFHKEIQEGMVAAGLKVSYFDYPLAPENTAEITESDAGSFTRLSFLYPDSRYRFFFLAILPGRFSLKWRSSYGTCTSPIDH